MKLNTKSLNIPTKEIKITAFEDTVTIYPIGGFALIKLQKLAKTLDNIEEADDSIVEAVRFALKWGCKCEDEDIQFLIDNDLVTCMELTKAVIEFSGEYASAKMDESTLAKKKLKRSSLEKNQTITTKN